MYGVPREKMVISKGGREVKDVDAILYEAKSIPNPKVCRCLYEYGESIHVMLHEKRMTYEDIAAWFAERGMEYAPGHFRNAYQKWCALNPVQQQKPLAPPSTQGAEQWPTTC